VSHGREGRADSGISVWATELFADASMEGFGWFFFRGPDRNVYAMQQDSRTHAA
jgi:hypothetical protein